MTRANRPMTRFLFQATGSWFFMLVISSGLGAQPPPSAEKQKIEMLIKHVAEMKEAEFVRNGKAYDATAAATFLRRKWQANDSQVRTAHDFVDKVASSSGTSGKPYLIRFKDGKEITSRDFLLLKLKTIEISSSSDRHSVGFGSSRAAGRRKLVLAHADLRRPL